MKYQKSDHFDGKKFFNPDLKTTKSFRDFLKWRMTAEPTAWPAWVENTVSPNLPTQVSEGEAHVTFINHATFLIQLRDLTLITDPVFSERASPVQWAGPKRVRKPGLSLEELPRVDVVLLSHNHYDHMDIASLKYLSDKYSPLILVPLGNQKLLTPEGIQNVVEMDWWDARTVEHKAPQPLRSSASETSERHAKITLVPAQHWSARGLFDRNEALWGGFVVEIDGLKLYFAGDTGYGALFKRLNERMGTMDLSLLPIGAYEPRWFMKENHMNPDDAVLAHLDLNSRLSIGTHFGTFKLTDEGIDDPPLALAKSLDERKVKSNEFVVPDVGRTYTVLRAALDPSQKQAQ